MTNDTKIKSVIFNLKYCQSAKPEWRDKWISEYKEITGKDWKDENA